MLTCGKPVMSTSLRARLCAVCTANRSHLRHELHVILEQQRVGSVLCGCFFPVLAVGEQIENRLKEMALGSTQKLDNLASLRTAGVEK